MWRVQEFLPTFLKLCVKSAMLSTPKFTKKYDLATDDKEKPGIHRKKLDKKRNIKSEEIEETEIT